MDTIVRKITGNEEENLKIYMEAARILKSGGLVAFPTETVYGLGADALDEKASSKIYGAKGRPSDNPLIVHISDVDALQVLAREIPQEAYTLADKFWPGPLTIILKKSDIVPLTITGGLDTVAIRMPGHKVAREMIRISGVYVAAPSANTSGKPSPTKASHVYHDLNGKIDMLIEDDTVDIGVESTIVDLTEEIPTILRPGFIDIPMLSEAIGEVRLDPGIMDTVSEGVKPKAPGMKYKHYAPEAQLTIVQGNRDDVMDYINKQVKEKNALGKKVAVMTTTEGADGYICDNIVIAGSSSDELSVAKNLYSILREFDDMKIDYVYSESFSTEHVGQAVMNRLIKAAGHTIVCV